MGFRGRVAFSISGPRNQRQPANTVRHQLARLARNSSSEGPELAWISFVDCDRYRVAWLG